MRISAVCGHNHEEVEEKGAGQRDQPDLVPGRHTVTLWQQAQNPSSSWFTNTSELSQTFPRKASCSGKLLITII